VIWEPKKVEKAVYVAKDKMKFFTTQDVYGCPISSGYHRTRCAQEQNTVIRNAGQALFTNLQADWCLQVTLPSLVKQHPLEKMKPGGSGI